MQPVWVFNTLFNPSNNEP